MKCYVFDIDGTLSDPTHRLHHIKGETKNWDAFFAACDQDAPIPHMVELARHLLTGTSEIVLFCTGRSDDVKDKTVKWLQRYFSDRQGPFIGSEDLYMRAAGDHRDDTVVKSELMDRIIADGYQPIMVFEDRSRVCQMWRARDIPCLQVAAGEF